MAKLGGLPPINLSKNAPMVMSPRQGHQVLEAASAWLAHSGLDGKRTLEKTDMYTTKGGSFTARSLNKMSDPARKLVIASGSLTAREVRQVAQEQQKPWNAEERELMKLLEHIAHKAAQKFDSPAKVTRALDPDHDGKIDRSEVRYFFREYGYPDRDADKFWDHMDVTKKAEFLNYDVFVSFLRPFLKAAFSGQSVEKTMLAAAQNKPHHDHGDQIAAVREEFRDALTDIEKQAEQRFHNRRFAWRHVKHDRGQITREATRYFFRVFGISKDVSNSFHDKLDFHGTGEISLEDFMAVVYEFIGSGNAPQPRNPPQRPTQATPRAPEGTQKPEEPERTTFRGSFGTSMPSFNHGVDPKLLQELRVAMSDIGQKIPLLFKHPREALRPLDLQRSGRIARKEMQYFFRNFNKTDQFADQVFDLLDPESKGFVDYAEFLSHFDAVFNTAHRNVQRAAIIPMTEVDKSAQVAEMVNAIGQRLVTKYKNVQEAFRDLDLNKDGKVSQFELRQFAKKMGQSAESADAFFDAMNEQHDPSGNIPYQNFINLFRDLRGEYADSRSTIRLPLLSSVGR